MSSQHYETGKSHLPLGWLLFLFKKNYPTLFEISCAQLERLVEFVGHKRKIQKIYNDELKNLPGVGIFPQPDWAEGACWLSGVTTSNIDLAKSLRGRLKENNIEAKPFWKSIHL